MIILLGLFLTGSVTAHAQSSSDFTYEENDSGITITSYTGDEKEVVVPAAIKDKKVTTIGEYAFMLCNTVEKVSVPSTVKAIASTAFTGTSNLKEVVLASDETKIEKPEITNKAQNSDKKGNTDKNENSDKTTNTSSNTGTTEQSANAGQGAEPSYKVVIDESVDREANTTYEGVNNSIDNTDIKPEANDSKSEIAGINDNAGVNNAEVNDTEVNNAEDNVAEDNHVEDYNDNKMSEIYSESGSEIDENNAESSNVNKVEIKDESNNNRLIIILVSIVAVIAVIGSVILTIKTKRRNR